MTNIGKIEGTLEDQSFSDEVEIAGAKWAVVRFSGSKFFVSCTVGDKGNDVLWSCTARGRLIVWDSKNEKHIWVWSDNFDNLYAVRSMIFEFPDCELETVKFTAEIEVINRPRIVDLCSPTNETIESRKDAACLEVEDKKLWVSKKILSVHSPVFKAVFSSGFKDKATGCYALTEVELVYFRVFLSILYNFDIVIGKDLMLEGVLRLGAKYKSDLVLRFCHAILSRSDKKFLPLETEIKLCDRYGFYSLLKTAIRNVELEELKQLVKKGSFAELSSYAHCLIEKRFLDSE
uniref:BTB domain-containing protein n=1 Tax=Steinernema glaseri TaxID=37863 RepID=A0A1I8AQV7_9BILA